MTAPRIVKLKSGALIWPSQEAPSRAGWYVERDGAWHGPYATQCEARDAIGWEGVKLSKSAQAMADFFRAKREVERVKP